MNILLFSLISAISSSRIIEELYLEGTSIFKTSGLSIDIVKNVAVKINEYVVKNKGHVVRRLDTVIPENKPALLKLVKSMNENFKEEIDECISGEELIYASNSLITIANNYLFQIYIFFMFKKDSLKIHENLKQEIFKNLSILMEETSNEKKLNALVNIYFSIKDFITSKYAEIDPNNSLAEPAAEFRKISQNLDLIFGKFKLKTRDESL